MPFKVIVAFSLPISVSPEVMVRIVSWITWGTPSTTGGAKSMLNSTDSPVPTTVSESNATVKTGVGSSTKLPTLAAEPLTLANFWITRVPRPTFCTVSCWLTVLPIETVPKS